MKHSRKNLFLVALILLTLAFSALRVTPAYAATLTVTNTNDSGVGSLRQAIIDAAPGDTITFVSALAGQTITLVSGYLNLNKPLTIDGSSLASPVSVNGNNAMNIFYITAGGTFTLKGLDIINGYASSTGYGGGIYVGAGGTTVNVNTIRLSGNRAPGGYGGALYIPGGGITVNVIDSTFADNGKGPGNTYGGAIYNGGGALNVTNSTFSGNSVGFAPLGGAIYNVGTAVVTNSTFSGNANNGNAGAAIYNAGGIFLTNSTLSGNTGYGAFYNANYAEVRNSIFANTVSGPDCVGNGFAVNTNNLIETWSGCSGPLTNADPNLGSLANNGGSTQTMALQAGSPAISTANSAVCAAAVGSPAYGAGGLDQRGEVRLSACDIGAYEAPPFALTVTKTADTNDGVCNSDCSLREAIAAAGANDTIVFTPTLAGQTITLVSGYLNLNKPLTIDGSSLASPVSVNGNNAMNIFYITAGGTFTLKGLDIINGYASSTGYGGGIYVGAGGTTVNVNTVRLSGNRAPGGYGGALYIPGGGITVNVIDSTFADNGKGPGNTYGGAIYNGGGALNVTNSTFSGNSVGFAPLGGAIYNVGTAVVTNSTFSGNANNGNAGAAIYNAGGIFLTNSTLSGNTGYGAFYNANYAEVRNSIFANTVSGPDCAGNGFAINTTNLIESQGGCSAPLINADPNLGPLANNGSSTQTFALLPGSPAINTGNNAICAAAPINNLDQRGVTRPQGAVCDIGAYEATVHPLTIAASGTGSGVITPTIGVYTYTYGTVVTVTASANTGSTFTGWSGACASNGVCEVTMTAAANVTGTFTLNTATITPTAGANGVITPDTPQVVNYGNSITFTIAANTGYHIEDVGVDDVSQGAIDSYTFDNVTASHTMTAAFAIDTFVITPTAGANGVITPDTPQVVNYGDSITFTIAANTGYHIEDVEVDDVSQGAIDNYTFDNVTADHTVTAAFALNTYTLTIATAGIGSGIVTPTVGMHPYLYGDVVTLAASASTGSTFAGWNGDADCVDGSVMMDADKSCTAMFTLNTYTLTIATADIGSGVVTPTVGMHPYLYGDPVSLAATANTGSTFAGWSGDADCVDRSVTMDADKACTATFTLNSPAGLSAINDGPTALGSVTTLTATIMDGINVTYAWNFGDGSLGAGATVTHTYAAAGTYTAIVTATNSAGSLAATTTVYITTNPIAHAGSDQTVHTGRSVTLDGNASFDPGNFLPLTYHWQQTGGLAVTLSDASNVTATFAAPVVTQTRTLTFELTVTNTQSLASSPDVVVITVEPYRVMLPLVMR